MVTEVDLNPVVLVRVSNKRLMEVKLIECPFCRKRHTHGIPPGVESPDIGHRVAHCATADLPLALRYVSRGYYLRLESSLGFSNPGVVPENKPGPDFPDRH